MKKIINLIALFLIIITANAQQLDRSVRPSAAPAKAIDIKDAQVFTLSNGLKVFVVEDQRAPIVRYSVSLDIYPALEGNKAGMQDLFSAVIGTATKTLSKEALNREIDLIGAHIGSHKRGGYASGLKKHETKMLELFSDMLLNPVFLPEELELNREKALSAFDMIGDDASALNQRVSNALTYGKGYPDGEVETKESIKNIAIADLEAFHRTYFAPNAARLVIVGDITLAQAKANAEKYFGKWAKKNVPVTKYTVPAAPAKAKIAFIEKSGAVQSAIDVSYPVELRVGAPDFFAANVMSHILGGGASGRLFQNLREQHSYTYGVYNTLSDHELIGRYQLTSKRGAAQVKAAATDSAIYYIREEMQRMINTPISAAELQEAKAYIAGSFGRALEDAGTLAEFALYIDKYKLPKDYYKNFLKHLDAVTVADVQAAAKKYLKFDNAWIVVAGDKSHAEALKQFSVDNTVQFYDMNVNPVAAPETKTADISAEQIINNYVKALGGVAAMEKINDYKMTMEVSAMGQKLEMVMAYKKEPRHTLTAISMSGMVVQKITFDGTTMKMSGMQGNQEFTEGDEFEAMKAEAHLCPDMYYAQNGYKLTVKGIEKVNGSDAYVLEAVKGKTVMLNYYSTATGLKVKSTTTSETPQGTATQVSEMSNYKEVGGVKFPHTIKQSANGMAMDATVKSIEVNKGLDKSFFE